MAYASSLLPYYISYNDLVNNQIKSTEWQKKWDIGDDEWDEIMGAIISRGEANYIVPVPKSWEAKMQQNSAKYTRFAAISASYNSKAESPPRSQVQPRGKGLMRPLPPRVTSPPASSSSSSAMSRLPDPFDFGDGRDREGSGLSPPRRERSRDRASASESSAADIQKATIDHVYKLGFEAGKIAASKEDCAACALRRQRNREAARKQRAEKE